jgi:signal transduction histidine kinase
MRQRLTAVFVAIVTAFVALDLVVLLSLWPQLQRSEALTTQYAATSRLLARMRGDLHAMRTAATQQHVSLRTGGVEGASLQELASARRDFEAAAMEYAGTPADPGESEVWQALSGETFPALLRAIDRAVVPAPGDSAPDSAQLAELGRVASDGDRMLQQLAEINAQSLAVHGQEINATVRTLVFLCLALGTLGIVGGILLVRWALGAVSEYERSMRERLQELDDFAGRVAHDLRNPLQAIGMSLSLIRKRTEDERTLATCAKAQQGAKRMADFIQELLTFARSGATPAHGASARVEQVLQEVEQDLAPEAEARKIRLLVRPAADVYAAISPEALRAIVGNLADNAVKHMPPEGTERRVELSSERGRSDVEIRVRDTGAGIPAEALPRLFDPFFRATDRPGGFGIGLKTVKRLVDAHGGRLQVETEAGRGSLFTVTLPAAAPPEPAAQAPPAARDANP